LGICFFRLTFFHFLAIVVVTRLFLFPTLDALQENLFRNFLECPGKFLVASSNSLAIAAKFGLAPSLMGYSCTVCDGPAGKKCSVCKITYYCSRACQREDFKRHKKICGKVTTLSPPPPPPLSPTFDGVAVKTSETKGRCAISTSAIKVGTTILTEPPLIPPVLNKDQCGKVS